MTELAKEVELTSFDRNIQSARILLIHSYLEDCYQKMKQLMHDKKLRYVRLTPYVDMLDGESFVGYDVPCFDVFSIEMSDTTTQPDDVEDGYCVNELLESCNIDSVCDIDIAEYMDKDVELYTDTTLSEFKAQFELSTCVIGYQRFDKDYVTPQIKMF